MTDEIQTKVIQCLQLVAALFLAYTTFGIYGVVMPKSPRIPRSFRLMAHQYEVKVIEEKYWKENDAVGQFTPSAKLIEIRAGDAQITEHTYYHELTHAILTAMGETRLSQKESFVDMFAGLIQQAITSAKY